MPAIQLMPCIGNNLNDCCMRANLLGQILAQQVRVSQQLSCLVRMPTFELLAIFVVSFPMISILCEAYSLIFQAEQLQQQK